MEPQKNLDIDLVGDATKVPTSPALAGVSTLVTEFDVLGAELAEIAQRVETLSARRKEITEKSLPDAMTEAGVTSFTTPTGRSVSIIQTVFGNIPAKTTIEKAKGPERAALEARRKTAIAVVYKKWPGLIKTELSLSLGKGEAEVALRIAELIRKEFKLSPSVDETIHPATLNSHFKELMEQGKLGDIPTEPFALYVGPIAKIK